MEHGFTPRRIVSLAIKVLSFTPVTSVSTGGSSETTWFLLLRYNTKSGNENPSSWKACAPPLHYEIPHCLQIKQVSDNSSPLGRLYLASHRIYVVLNSNTWLVRASTSITARTSITPNITLGSSGGGLSVSKWRSRACSQSLNSSCFVIYIWMFSRRVWSLLTIASTIYRKASSVSLLPSSTIYATAPFLASSATKTPLVLA